MPDVKAKVEPLAIVFGGDGRRIALFRCTQLVLW